MKRILLTLGILLCLPGILQAQAYKKSYEKGKFDKALEQAESARESDSKNFEAYWYSALSRYQLFLESGKESELKRILKTLVSLHKKDKEGDFQPDKGEWEYMRDRLLEAIWKARPENQTALLSEFTSAYPELDIRPQILKQLYETDEDAAEDYLKSWTEEILSAYIWENNAPPGTWFPFLLGVDKGLESGRLSTACFWMELFQEAAGQHPDFPEKAGLYIGKIFEQLTFEDVYRDNVQRAYLLWNESGLLNSQQRDTLEAFLYDGFQASVGVQDSAYTYELLKRYSGLCDSLGRAQPDAEKVWKEYYASYLKFHLEYNPDSLFGAFVVQKGLNCYTGSACYTSVKDTLTAYLKRHDFIRANAWLSVTHVLFDKKKYAQLAAVVKDFIKNSDVSTLEKFEMARQNEVQIELDPGMLDALYKEAGKYLLAGNAAESGSRIYLGLWKDPKNESWIKLQRDWMKMTYKLNYTPGDTLDIGKNYVPGAACNSGKLSGSCLKLVAQRLDFFRQMAGIFLPVVWDDAYNQKAQDAAFLMEENGELSHNPPKNWKCYSESGFQGASSSNLAMGDHSTGSVNLWMFDNGHDCPGHRYWILNPMSNKMGFGTTENASALYVFGGLANEPEGYEGVEYPVTWPSPYYFPTHLMPDIWSFSWDIYSFSEATVRIWIDGVEKEAEILSREGYAMASISFRLKSYVEALENKKIKISIENMRDGGGKAFSYTYWVYPVNPLN